MNVEGRVREISERVAASSGLEVVDVELHGGGKARMLRITIDRQPGAPAPSTPGDGSGEAQAAVTGVTHGDCERMSREVGTILDVEDVIPGASYTLEVSSPGLDRKLSAARDFQRFTGSLVKLMTREPVDGQRHFEGRLQSFADGRLTLVVEPPRSKKKQKLAPAHGQFEIDLANVEKANLVPEI
jgi:ribosome maturation factor RimP